MPALHIKDRDGNTIGEVTPDGDEFYFGTDDYAECDEWE